MLGYPKYKRGDKVLFKCADKYRLTIKIEEL